MRSGKIGAVLLAAGSSSRLGRAKQLLILEGQPLVRRAATAALNAGCHPVVVVTGEAHLQLSEALDGSDVVVHWHPEWSRGIGSSLRAGVERAIIEAPMMEALLALVTDQPFVSERLLRGLIRLHESSELPATACHYSGGAGVPAIFRRDLFAQLAQISDHQGAKGILTSLQPSVALLEFPLGAVDIDTLEDWEKLQPLVQPSRAEDSPAS